MSERNQRLRELALGLEEAEEPLMSRDRRRLAAQLREIAENTSTANELLALKDALAQREAEIAQLEAERDEARAIVAGVNGSVFGSHGYFTVPDCVEQVEVVKMHHNQACARAEAREAEIAALRQLVVKWRERGEVMCPPLTGEQSAKLQEAGQFDSIGRAIGAILLQHADQVDAALRAEGPAPPPEP